MSRTSKRATLRTCWSRILVFVWVSPLCLPPKSHSNRLNHLWGYERGLAFVCVCVSQNRWNQVTVFLFFVLAWKVSGSDVVLGAYLIDFIRIEWVGCILFEGRKCWLLWFHFSFFWSTIPSGKKIGGEFLCIIVCGGIRRSKAYHVIAFSLEIATNRMCDFTGSDLVLGLPPFVYGNTMVMIWCCVGNGSS